MLLARKVSVNSTCVGQTSKTLNKKIRENQLAQYNYILVVGKEEMEKGTVNIRTRDNVVQGSKTIAELLAEFEKMMDDRTLDVELGVPKSADKGDAEQ